jgi:hypothetical protein
VRRGVKPAHTVYWEQHVESPAHTLHWWWAVDKVVSPAGLPAKAAAPEKPADLTAATDNLAKLLSKKKRSFNKPWYDGLES